MTEPEALALLEINVPLAAEPLMAAYEYKTVLALYQISATAWNVLRASAHVCRQKAARSAEMHARGADATQEQQVFANWMRLAEEFDKRADAASAETVIAATATNPYAGSVVAYNVAVW